MRVRRLNSTFAYAVRLSASTADQNKASNKHEAMEKVGFNIRSFNKGGGGGGSVINVASVHFSLPKIHCSRRHNLTNGGKSSGYSGYNIAGYQAR